MRVVGSVRFFVHHINHKEPMCDFSSYTKCIVHSTSRLLHRIFHQTKRAKTTLEECIIYRQQNFKRKSKDIRYNCFHHFKMSVMQHLHIYSFFSRRLSSTTSSSSFRSLEVVFDLFETYQTHLCNWGNECKILCANAHSIIRNKKPNKKKMTRIHSWLEIYAPFITCVLIDCIT